MQLSFACELQFLYITGSIHVAQESVTYVESYVDKDNAATDGY